MKSFFFNAFNRIKHDIPYADKITGTFILHNVKDLFFNDALKERMAKNLARIDAMNDVSEMIADIEKLAEA